MRKPLGTPVMLLHGAWQGAWVWDSQIAPLQAAGFDAIALDLPGNGADGRAPGAVNFADHVAHARAALLAAAAPVHIVAHSGAGVLATQLAENHPDKVAQLIYVAGMMLPSGVTFPEMVAPFVATDPAAIGIGAFLHMERGGSSVPQDAAIRIFYHDCPPDAARSAAMRLTLQGEAVRAPRVVHTAANAGRVPRSYLRCGADRSVVPAVQDAMCAAWPGARLRRLDCGHAPMLAAPDMLAQTLVGLLTTN
ncbi:alpha/beta fold hydrolase [Roseinatronobacter sp. NSM]|uniref:alpha/beta fold hydrolase n=1 Tax=Roseinatronobacter sp. NSM TaxID=3457785 RepID=UPI004035E674